MAAFGVFLLGMWGLLFAFVILGTYPRGVAGGAWGSTSTKVVTGAWLFGLAAITEWNLWRELRYLRGVSPNGT